MPTHTLVRLCAHICVAQLSLTHVRRQQYYQQSRVVPDFAKLYDVCNFCIFYFFRKFSILQNFQNFISLEADIEESLPNFQELLMTLRCGLLTKYGDADSPLVAVSVINRQKMLRLRASAYSTLSLNTTSSQNRYEHCPAQMVQEARKIGCKRPL